MHKKRKATYGLSLLAEDEGFKPPIPKKGIPDFESSAFGHSANLPYVCIAKVMIIFVFAKI